MEVDKIILVVNTVAKQIRAMLGFVLPSRLSI